MTPPTSRKSLVADDRRAAPRLPVRIGASLRRPGRPTFAVDIIDLSATGCQCETVSRIPLGSTLWLTIGTLAPIEAIVRWETPFGFGVEWARPLHVSILEHICSCASPLR